MIPSSFAAASSAGIWAGWPGRMRRGPPEKRKAAHEADQAGLVVTEIQWLIRNDEATAALVRERII